MKKAVLIAAVGISFVAATLSLAKFRAGRPSPGSASDTKETTSQPARADSTAKSVVERREQLRQSALRNKGNAALISCLLRCTACHDLKGQKEIVGPPLTDIADRLTREEIIAQLLEPDKRAAMSGRISVVFQNGRSEEFRLVENSNDTLRVGDEQGKIRDIPKQEIEEYAPVPSQMPSGLVDDLTPQQFTDLVDFLMGRRKK